MQTFIVLYQGPATPEGASHAGWPEWFTRLGGKLIDVGSPMQHGFVLLSDGSTSDSSAGLKALASFRQRVEMRWLACSTTIRILPWVMNTRSKSSKCLR
jgi:hypothetical protein